MKFTPEGVSSVFARTGTDSPVYFTIVPEPSPSAVLGLGFAALLALSRAKERRR
jgi:hypothetical protein